jgi:hypothetical protein
MLKYLKTKSIPKKKKKTKYRYIKYTIYGVLWAVIVPILIFLIQIAPVSNSRWLYLLFHNGLIIYFIFPVISLIVIIGGPTGLIVLIVSFFQKLERWTLRTVGIVLLINFIATSGVGKLAQQVRNNKLGNVAKNTLAVIAALQAYHAEQGKYPNVIIDLIPKYTDKLPATEMIGYPIFEYEKVEFISGMMKKPVVDDTQNKWVRFETGGYEIRLLPPISGNNFDRFIYWPKKIYPRYMYGGLAEQIGDWVYVNE